jgi:methylated-DNA-protein-cysteine methyltransferase related protein
LFLGDRGVLGGEIVLGAAVRPADLLHLPHMSKMRIRIESAIRQIPSGKVSTYGAVAKAAGLPGAARQVVASLRGSVGLPWHRVLGAGGEIKLRGASALEQRFRLESEGVRFRGRRVDMKAHEFRFGERKPPVGKSDAPRRKSAARVPTRRRNRKRRP